MPTVRGILYPDEVRARKQAGQSVHPLYEVERDQYDYASMDILKLFSANYLTLEQIHWAAETVKEIPLGKFDHLITEDKSTILQRRDSRTILYVLRYPMKSNQPTLNFYENYRDRTYIISQILYWGAVLNLECYFQDICELEKNRPRFLPYLMYQINQYGIPVSEKILNVLADCIDEWKTSNESWRVDHMWLVDWVYRRAESKKLDTNCILYKFVLTEKQYVFLFEHGASVLPALYKESNDSNSLIPKMISEHKAYIAQITQELDQWLIPDLAKLTASYLRWNSC